MLVNCKSMVSTLQGEGQEVSFHMLLKMMTLNNLEKNVLSHNEEEEAHVEFVSKVLGIQPPILY